MRRRIRRRRRRFRHLRRRSRLCHRRRRRRRRRRRSRLCRHRHRRRRRRRRRHIRNRHLRPCLRHRCRRCCLGTICRRHHRRPRRRHHRRHHRRRRRRRRRHHRRRRRRHPRHRCRRRRCCCCWLAAAARVSSSLSPSPLAHSPGSVGATCMQPAPLALHRDTNCSWTSHQSIRQIPQPQSDKRVVSQDETPRRLARTRSCRDDPRVCITVLFKLPGGAGRRDGVSACTYSPTPLQEIVTSGGVSAGPYREITRTD